MVCVRQMPISFVGTSVMAIRIRIPISVLPDHGRSTLFSFQPPQKRFLRQPTNSASAPHSALFANEHPRNENLFDQAGSVVQDGLS